MKWVLRKMHQSYQEKSMQGYQDDLLERYHNDPLERYHNNPIERYHNDPLENHQHKSIQSDQGSATVEFVIFGLPFLVAALTFFATLHASGYAKSQGGELAREAVQAFVNSQSDIEGYLVVSQILNAYAQANPSRLDATGDKFPDSQIVASNNPIHFTIRCERYPCISPANVVTIQLFRFSDNSKKIPMGSARSTVSRWIP